tara:strand:+ start:1389 stop:2033 length:645 start_codon:yes stop_codon:yes gene_type:complete
MAEFKIELNQRKELGNKSSKYLRDKSMVPGIFYSSTEKSFPFYIEKKHMYDALRSSSRVYSLNINGKELYAIFKEIQYHPVSDEIIHIDLYGVSLKDKINLSIPIILKGESPGVKMGGMMTQSLLELEVSCPASKVPEFIEIDISKLELGNILHVSDLEFDDFEIITSDDATIVSIQVPKEEQEEEQESDEEVEEKSSDEEENNSSQNEGSEQN